MLGGADNPNGELPSYITGADTGELLHVTSSGFPINVRRSLARLKLPEIS